MRHALNDLLGFTATAALMVLSMSGPVLAKDPVAGKPRTALAAEAPALIPLPTGHDELVFRGENTTRSWPVYLDRNAAGTITQFQFALLNTISVLPNRSTIRLSINGVDVASIPASSAQTPTIVAVDIPKGLLAPGFNAVSIATTLVHRVDCSVAATHELWALLKPDQTGFLMPPRANAAPPAIEDLAGERLAADGTTRLHLRTADGTSPADLDRAGRFIAALVRRTHMVRPIVDVGPAVGSGTGLDLVIGKTSTLRAAGIVLPSERVSADSAEIGRDPFKNRLVLSLSAPDDAGLDAALADFVAASARAEAQGTPSGLARLAQRAGSRVEGGQVYALKDLGFGEANVVGRRFIRSLSVAMPDDGYSGSVARAHLYLDGTRAGDLDPTASMTVRVNGKIAYFSPIGSGFTETFRRHRIDLPLNAFHPGQNELEIEAVTPARADEACNTVEMRNSVRLSISGDSQLEFPTFAHLQVTPELANATRSAREATAIYLPDATRPSLGNGLTVAALLASSSRRETIRGSLESRVAFHLAPPLASDPPGIVVAPLDRLPADLSGALSSIATSAPELASEPDDASAGPRPNPDPSRPRIAATPAAAAHWDRFYTRASTTAWSWWQRGHFYFGGTDRSPPMLPVTGETLILAALEPDARPTRLAGVVLPRVSTRSDQWLVLSGVNATIVHAGIERLVVDRTWPRLAGQAASLALDTGELRVRPSNDPTYVMPKSLVFEEIRPILGSFMSDNIILSALVLLALLATLGGSTHLLIRKHGDR